MSKNVLRKDKTCLNCRYVVEKRFCANCGQENIETRKSFHHLFLHFFEDLTHYENAFWKTIKNLLFKPGSLTKEYLSGKRLSYLAPVRLYIFISFITFFLISIIPNETIDNLKVNPKESNKSALENSNFYLKKENKNTNSFDLGYKSVEQLDSIQTHGPQNKKLSSTGYYFTRKAMLVLSENTIGQIVEKFKESFIHNLPKVLFVYMPIFAFVLWIFQDKKRWFYFDHGIFTLHYFSFLLLLILLMFLSNKLLSYFDNGIVDFISGTIYFVGFSWMILYFFPAHRRFYQEKRKSSILKGLMLFLINSVLIISILLIFIFYTFLNLH